MDGGLVRPELLPWLENMSAFTFVFLFLVFVSRNSISAQLHGITACALCYANRSTSKQHFRGCFAGTLVISSHKSLGGDELLYEFPR